MSEGDETIEERGRVLHLADFDPARPGRIVAEIRAHWQSLRKGRAIPERAEIDPRGIRRALEYSFILERIAPGAARFRLAGRHLVDLMGMEVRGMPLASFFNPSSRGRMSDVLESVFQGPQIAELRLLAEAGYARPALSGRMVLLPLRSDFGDVTRILGCLIAEGEVGSGPRRFDILSDEVEALFPGAKVIAPTPGFREEPDPWRAPRRPAQLSDMLEGGEDGRPSAAAGAETPETESPKARRARFRIVSNTVEPPKGPRL